MVIDSSNHVEKEKIYILCGTIIDAEENVISSAKVWFGNEEVLSDVYGKFKLETTLNSDQKIIVRKNGYKSFSDYIVPPNCELQIKLIKK